MSKQPGDSNTFRLDEAPDARLDREIQEALGDQSLDEILDAGEQPAGDDAEAEALPGGLQRAKVVAINKNDIFVDMGGRSQGVITADQFETEKIPEVGDTIEVLFDHYDDSEGLIVLTLKGAAQKVAWATLAKGDIVEARVTGVNKGGLECDLSGIRAFMPASQADTLHIKDLSTLIGERLRCRITELDRKDKNIVLSRRVLLEEEAAEAKQKTMAEIAEGQVRSGRVRSIMPYGAFVDIGGVDGLLHVSDMSYSRVEDPNDLVKVGQQLQVQVLKIETGGKRISLGLKQLQPSPWEGAGDKYTPGATVTGKVTNLAKFGAFVEIEPGLEALVPISEMTWKKRVNHPSEILTVGQQVEASILAVDTARQRMSISLKAVEDDPWLGAESRFATNTVVPGTVTRVVDFGAFIELEPGVEGLAHISELSDKPIQRPSDAARPGQQVQARVLTVSETHRRISLSLKVGPEEAEAEGQADQEARPRKKSTGPLKGGLE